MAIQIQLRRDTTTNWESVNPILAIGEIGLDTTLLKFKVGNGTSSWSELDYYMTGPKGDSILNGTGAPSDLVGNNGEFYLDTSVYDLYGPKSNGTWGSFVSLIGPIGPTGNTGPIGPTGNTGPIGPTGNTGAGIIVGGTTGQALIKSSNTDYDTEWGTIISSPSGSDTQVQFNDGGSFGGDSGLTFNKTTNALTVGGATVTANAPVLDLSQTWNNAGVTFTGLKFNVTDTASAAGSLLMDLQVGGVSAFRVFKNSRVYISSDTYPGSASNGAGYYISTVKRLGAEGNSTVLYDNNGNRCLGFASVYASVIIPTTYSYSWGGSTAGLLPSAPDTHLYRDAANTLAQRNSTNAQTFRLYRTYTSGTDLAYTALKQDATTGFILDSVNATAAEPTNLLDLQLNGSSKFKVAKDGALTLPQATFTSASGVIFGISNCLVFNFGGGGGAAISANAGNKGYVLLDSAASFSWGAYTSLDLALYLDAANTLAQRNSTNAQTFRLYNTYTDASNYERGKFEWASNVLRIGTEKAGSGSARALEFQTDGTTRLTIATGGGVSVGAFTATSITSGPLSLGATDYFAWSGRGGFYASADGKFRIRDNADSGDTTLIWGSATSSFPSIKRSTTLLQARLADDSDYATYQGKIQTHANAVSETVTTTHTLILYDAVGNAYKVPCAAV